MGAPTATSRRAVDAPTGVPLPAPRPSPAPIASSAAIAAEPVLPPDPRLLRPTPLQPVLLDMPPPPRDASFAGWRSIVYRRALVEGEYQAFRGVLTRRMLGSYGDGSGWPIMQRLSALKALDTQLDFHMNGVAFRDDLRELSRRDDVGAFLTALEHALSNAASTGERVPLFALAETYAGSADEATRWLAVLLQDVRFRAATDDYWVGEVPQTLEPRFERIMALLSTNEVRACVDPYPPGVDIRNDGFYHYYAPAYLAQKMIKAGVPGDLAAATATVFNAEYELNQLSGDRSAPSASTSLGRTLEATRDTLVFIRDGVHAATDLADDSMQQIYAGYVGAMRAAGRQPRSYADLHAAMLRDPTAALRAIVHGAPLGQ